MITLSVSTVLFGAMFVGKKFFGWKVLPMLVSACFVVSLATTSWVLSLLNEINGTGAQVTGELSDIPDQVFGGGAPAEGGG